MSDAPPAETVIGHAEQTIGDPAFETPIGTPEPPPGNVDIQLEGGGGTSGVVDDNPEWRRRNTGPGPYQEVNGAHPISEEAQRDFPYGDAIPLSDQARAAGHSWQDIDNHVAQASTAAVAAGYTQPEIDQHLGYQPPDRMLERARATFASRMQDSSDLLDGLSKQDPELALSTPSLPGDYARAVLSGETKGPLDFAQNYAAAALQAAAGNTDDTQQSPATVQSWLRAAGVAANEMAMTLPNPRDLTDAALSVGGAFDTARQNLLDHWQETGEHPIDAAVRAQADPQLTAKLTTPPQPSVNGDDPFGRILDAIGFHPTPNPQTGLLDTPIIGKVIKGAAAGAEAPWQGGPAELTQYLIDLSRRYPGPITQLGASGAVGVDLAVRALMTIPGFVAGGGWGLLDSVVPQGAAGTTKTPEAIGRDLMEIANSFPTAEIPGVGGLSHLKVPVKVIDLAKEPGEAIHEAPAQEAFSPVTPAAREPVPETTGAPAAPSETPGVPEAPGPRPFVETATPAEKIEALAQEKLGMQSPEERIAPMAARTEDARLTALEQSDEFSNPNFFSNLAKNEDPATQKLAAGYDAGRTFGGWLWEDQGGAVSIQAALGYVPRVIKALLSDDPSYQAAYQMLRKFPAVSNLRAAYVASRMEPFIKSLQPHMAEWTSELEKGPVGDPMNTAIGQMIRYIEGQSVGVTLDQSHPLYPLATVIREANQWVRTKIEDAQARGLIDGMGYYEDYYRHLWKLPEEADRAFGAGMQGSRASFMQRSIPTIADGLARGLEMRYPDPIENVIHDVQGKMRFLADAEIRKQAVDQGWAKWGDRIKPPEETAGWVKLRGVRNTRQLYYMVKDAEGNEKPGGHQEQLWAAPGFARLYNNWADSAINPLGDFAQRLAYFKNATVGLNLLIPLYHAWTMTVETIAGGLGNALQEGAGALRLLAQGHPLASLEELGRGVADTLHTAAFPVKLATSMRRGRRLGIDAITGANNPTIQLLTDNGMRFGSRQEVYRPGRATDILTSFQRGRLMNDLPLAHPLRSIVHPFQTVAWAEMQMTAPLFDYAIPYLKQGVIAERAETFLRQNRFGAARIIDGKYADADLVNRRMRQIIDNTDDRMGELNQENLFWPRWAKQVTNATMLSTGWVYGTIRSTMNAFGLRTAGRERGFVPRLEWNPVATSNLAGLFVATAGINSLYQYMKTGTMPQDPLDLMFPRTGGFGVAGAAARAFTPGTTKEYYDWAKIALETASAGHDAGIGAAIQQFFQGSKDYADGKLYGLLHFVGGLFSGEDAVGHKVAYTPGGLAGYGWNTFGPYVFTNWDRIKEAANIGGTEKLFGVREASRMVEDYAGWQGVMTGLHNRWSKAEITRAAKEGGTYAPAPRGGGGARGRTTAPQTIERYNSGRAAPAQRRSGGGHRRQHR